MCKPPSLDLPVLRWQVLKQLPSTRARSCFSLQEEMITWLRRMRCYENVMARKYRASETLESSTRRQNSSSVMFPDCPVAVGLRGVRFGKGRMGGTRAVPLIEFTSSQATGRLSLRLQVLHQRHITCDSPQ